MSDVFTQRYETQKTRNGYSFVFYCDLCEFAVHTKEYVGLSFNEALAAAEVYGKKYFNRCHKCGKWVCDEHYDINSMECSECAPINQFYDRVAQSL